MAHWLKRYASTVLLFGDWIALLLFVLVGEYSHGLNATNLFSTFVPLAILWLIAGWMLNAFPHADAVNPRSLFGNAVNCWLVVVPLSLFVRALLLNSAVILVPFFAAALGFSGLFVLVWRFVFFILWRFADKS